MSKKLSKVEYAQMMKETRKKINETLDDHILDLIRDQEEFVSFLDLYSRMNYTMLNAILIHAANPNATAIRSFAKWNELGIRVKNKEKGFYILEPNGTYIRPDGSTATSFKPRMVYDISQTDAGSAEPRQYNLRDVRDSLVFGNPGAYEGMNLGDSIVYACRTFGEQNDNFTRACAEYAAKHRFGVVPNSFQEDVVNYFLSTTAAAVALNWTREMENIYRPIVRKIEYGLRIKAKENKADEQQG